MIDLILYYNSKQKSIEGYSYEEYIDILKGTSDITVSRIAQGLIRLSDRGILKCVKEYYSDDEDNAIPSNRKIDSCFSITKQFDINVSRHQCVQCHLRCAELLESGTLNFKTHKRKKI